MSAEKLPEFGTGLRSALERRGALRSHVAPVGALRLLVREPQDAAPPRPSLVGARLAPAA